MSFSVDVLDWNVARKYGCKLSYANFKKLHTEQRENVKRVVVAWCEHLRCKK